MVYLTERQIIHKDIKPENILVDKDFHIKVYYTLWPVIHSDSIRISSCLSWIFDWIIFQLILSYFCWCYIYIFSPDCRGNRISPVMINMFFLSSEKKIADLGLATCQAWSRLTKEESRRKSRKGRSAEARGAGTLSYMAPEHLESIHTPSTEKSDVYSFAIVVWVILTGGEPYASELGGQNRHILSMNRVFFRVTACMQTTK